MALIKCPECGKDLSTAAKACPHCGFVPTKIEKSYVALESNEHSPIVTDTQATQNKNTKSFSPIAILLLIFIIFLSVLGFFKLVKDNTSENFTENASKNTDTGDEVKAQNLPAKIKYNVDYITLESVEVYEMKLEHSYAVFIISKLNVCGLDENARYWLRNNDLDYNIYITNSKNGYDYCSAVKLGNVFYTDTNQLVYVHTSSFINDNRYPFTNSKFSISLDITQEDTYKYVDSNGNTSERHKINSLNYSYSSEGTLNDFNNLSTSLKKQIDDWLYERAGFYGNLFPD